MSQTRTEHIKEFLGKITSANKEFTKKEAFKDLLNRLYAENEETKSVIDAISSGAEYSILNIPRKDKVHRGSADTLYNKIIIEFENDLKKTQTHAKQQIAGYLLGQFNSGEGYNYTMIVSDFINWKVFAPDVSQLEIIETLKEDELILNEIESSSFTLTEHNTEAFYLSAIFNSTLPNLMMKDFQSKGLFGARDVSKKILDVYFPRFSASDERHSQLARLSETCHQRAKEFTPTAEPSNLGRLRLAVKQHLKDEMTAIDALVGQMLA